MSHRLFQGILWVCIAIIFLAIILLGTRSPQAKHVEDFRIQTPQDVCAVKG